MVKKVSTFNNLIISLSCQILNHQNNLGKVCKKAFNSNWIEPPYNIFNIWCCWMATWHLAYLHEVQNSNMNELLIDTVKYIVFCTQSTIDIQFI